MTDDPRQEPALPDTPKRRRLAAVAKPQTPPPNAEVLGFLRALLKRAEQGEITEIAAAWMTDESTGETDWTRLEFANTMIGELMMMANEISEAARKDDDE